VDGLEPLAKLGEAHVRNFHQEHPDQTRWYQGEPDLSALLWLRRDGALLHVAVLTTDDDAQFAAEEGGIGQHDHLRLVLADDGGVVRELLVARVADRAALAGNRDQVSASVARTGDGPPAGRTFYHVRLPVAGWSGRTGRLSVEVADRDGDTLKQTLRFGDPSAPASGSRFRVSSR